ncbi:MAG: abortive infection family protein [Chloroflexota bacterium]|nr:abortive infection family protein [Chloroflexota bacterium]
MLTEELASVLPRFCEDQGGPSHDEIDRLIRRAGFDPLVVGARRVDGDSVGKMKRLRDAFGHALDHASDKGWQLCLTFMAAVKAAGRFRVGTEEYVGEHVISAARDAFSSVGYELDVEGNLRPRLIEDLGSLEAHAVLLTYVRRAQRGASDAAHVTGTSKDLLEATARHVLLQRLSDYRPKDDFPTTLFNAFYQLELKPAPELLSKLSGDSHEAVEQCLYLLANAVNRLRNAEGTGHGRPTPPRLSDDEARLTVQAMGLISQFLLNKLDDRRR